MTGAYRARGALLSGGGQVRPASAPAHAHEEYRAAAGDQTAMQHSSCCCWRISGAGRRRPHRRPSDRAGGTGSSTPARGVPSWAWELGPEPPAHRSFRPSPIRHGRDVRHGRGPGVGHLIQQLGGCPRRRGLAKFIERFGEHLPRLLSSLNAHADAAVKRRSAGRQPVLRRRRQPDAGGLQADPARCGIWTLAYPDRPGMTPASAPVASGNWCTRYVTMRCSARSPVGTAAIDHAWQQFPGRRC